MRQYESPYRLGTTQAVTVAATSAATAATVGARLIRVASTTDCHIAFGAAPTATTSSPLLPAGVVEYIIVEPSYKVAAIQNAAGGTLTVTALDK